MLDALLINPSLHKKDARSIWRSVDSCMPSLGLAYIAAYVRKKGFSVRILDCPAINISLQSFENYLKRSSFSKIKYVGFTATTISINNAYELAKIVKKLYPDSKIVFGGPHPTVCPEEVILKEFVDIVVIGEGEITFSEILSNKDLSRIKGICYLKRDKIRYTPPRERIRDLDDLPFPAYDLLPMDKYFPAKGSYQKLPAISMLTTRGCPGRCTFCSKVLGDLLVHRSAESLCKEIRMLKREYGIKQIMFFDDTFTAFKDNVRRLCEILIEQKIDILWSCFSRVDFVDPEILRLMKEAGCHQIMYGIESADEKILKNINKRTNLTLIEKVVRWTKSAGIDIRAAFMIGTPGETKSSILKTLRFAIELNPEFAIFNITTPYPGTKMFEDAKDKNEILTYNWDDYDLSKPILNLHYLSSEEVQFYYRYCYRKFYLRLNYFLLWFSKIIKNPFKIKILIEGLRAFSSFMIASPLIQQLYSS